MSYPSKRFFASAFLASSLLVANAVPTFAEDTLKTAIFAGGCFWCVESDFDHVQGVVETVSGYSGGSTTENVTYRNHADHREVVKITYDSTKVSYNKLLDVFWRSVDPTDGGGQFCDRGHTYSTAIYTLDEEQAKLAAASKAKLESDKTLPDPIKTEIAAAGPFFDAEDYHQNYYNVNPLRYKYYRHSCGRDARVDALWGDQAHLGIMK